MCYYVFVLGCCQSSTVGMVRSSTACILKFLLAVMTRNLTVPLGCMVVIFIHHKNKNYKFRIKL